MSFDIRHGDCREVMARMDAESVDAIVSDPPYGLSFMGKGWDHGVPGVEFWTEALRVAKPGTHLLAFGGTRTYHRLACAIEDAGWEIRDCVMWVYGSGFPKSHDVSKAIDKAAGAERGEVVGISMPPPDWQGYEKGFDAADILRHAGSDVSKNVYAKGRKQGYGHPILAPATDAARQWSGWGTALKPAWEPVIVARKPLVGTVAENVQRHGTGAINVDGCRVGTEAVTINTWNDGAKPFGGGAGHEYTGRTVTGRWPANVIHDGSEEVVGLFPVTTSGANPTRRKGIGYGSSAVGQPDCDAPRGVDQGSAARFFYCAKASKEDREEGLDAMPCRDTSLKYNGGDGFAGRTLIDGEWVNTDKTNRSKPKNHHPTVKPTALMRYLCRLVTPPGGLVLDPFCGSGSTGKAAVLEGFRFIGIEREAEYVEIARARIAAARPEQKLF